MLDLSFLASLLAVGAPFAALAYFYGRLNQKVSNIFLLLARDRDEHDDARKENTREHKDLDIRIREVEKLAHPYKGQ